MKKNVAFLCILILLTCSARSQDDNIFNRINGTNLKYNLYMRYNPDAINENTKFECYIDRNEEAGWQTLDNIDYFNVKNDFLNDFKIFMQFYNPLKYSLNSSVSDVADPTYNSINEYMSQLSKTTIAPNAVASKTFTSKAFSFTTPTITGVSNTYLESVLLSEWLVVLDDNIVDVPAIALADPNDPRIALYANLQSNLNKIIPVEDYLYDGISIGGVDGKKSISTILKDQVASLYNCESYIDFSNTLQSGKSISEQIKNKKKEAEENLKLVTDILSTGFDDNISKVIKTTPNPTKNAAIDKENKDRITRFKKYTMAVASRLKVITTSDLNLNNEIINKFDDLVTKLTTFIADYKYCGPNNNIKEATCEDHYKIDYDMKLTWKDQKMESVKYSMSTMNPDGSIKQDKGNKPNDCEFTVAKKLTFYSFISTGVLYTDFAYPIYKLDENKTVQHTGDEKINLRPAVFLNMLITNWDPIYPFIQLGVTSGKGDLLVPLGLGFTLNNQLSISGGTMLGYRKDLDKLQVGKTAIDDAALEKDLTNKPVVSWYFSLNYNLGKK